MSLASFPCSCDRDLLFAFAKGWWMCSFERQQLYWIGRLWLQNAIQMISANPPWIFVFVEQAPDNVVYKVARWNVLLNIDQSTDYLIWLQTHHFRQNYQNNRTVRKDIELRARLSNRSRPVYPQLYSRGMLLGSQWIRRFRLSLLPPALNQARSHHHYSQNTSLNFVPLSELKWHKI
jgi:hypothetical protein